MPSAPEPARRWWAVTIEADPSRHEEVAAWFYAEGAGGVEWEDGRPTTAPWADEPVVPTRPPAVRAYFPDDARWTARRRRLWRRARAHGLAVTAEALREEDWAEAWKQYWTPTRPGERIWVVPAWLDPPDPAAPTVRLDPGMAFGTGTHPTTAMMIRAIERAVRPGEFWIDVGTGSGILALAAWLMGARVAAVDPDPVAVAVAAANFAAHGAPIRLEAGTVTALAGAEPADGLCANLTTDLLRAEMPRLVERVRPGGRLLLSGVVDARRAEVSDAMAVHGVMLEDVEHEAGWCLLVGRRP
ncbi:MAG: 50S ribosomal protein L11 methyltransferase [Actinomycetia bacterium]|nr:50S ribosomal protein L11 methyltransferase [Actinomycetes bacterium]